MPVAVAFSVYTPKYPHRPSGDWDRRIHRPFPKSLERAKETAMGIHAREKTRVVITMGSADALCIILPAQDIAELKVMEIG